MEARPGENPEPERAGILRRTLRLAAGAAALSLALVIFAYVVRDRTRWLAVVMYVPMGFVALAAIVAHVAAFERRRWKRRVAAMLIAMLAAVVWIAGMRGSGGAVTMPSPAMSIVQWNVQWGRDEAGWQETVKQIHARGPDIVILSEAPPDEKIAALCGRLGEEWTFKVSRHPPRSRYWYAIAVLSRGPIEVEAETPLPNGAALRVTTAADGQTLRILAVDGQSDPLLSRTPMLAAVAEQCGDDVDIIAGDFNAVSRSVGFDGVEAKGFTLASRACRGWRGTYPANLPVYDIDHIWLSRRFAAAECVMLDSPGTNHRGQSVSATPRPPAAN